METNTYERAKRRPVFDEASDLSFVFLRLFVFADIHVVLK